MGLYNKTMRIGRRLFHRPLDNRSSRSARRLGFERIEPRRLLAADVQLGAVYFEEATGDDSQPDVIQMTFEGGAPGTRLTRLIIDGDKRGDGLTDGDAFFDIAAGGPGAFGHVGLTILQSAGFTVTNVTVVDGGTQIVFDLDGFDAGEKLVFSIDVDEAGFVEAGQVDATSIVEGGEFQRSKLSGRFVAPHFETLQLDGVFWDAYDGAFAAAQAAAGSSLQLPADRYSPQSDLSDRTAGAVAHDVQTPLPIEISGRVYLDSDLDVQQDAGEPGLAGVAVELWRFDEAAQSYSFTGKTAVTNAAGDYRFGGDDGSPILPGRYEIREIHPAGYFSVGASAGKVDGVVVGAVLDRDRIGRVDLLGGQNSLGNNFAEALPAEISGYVYHDANNNGRRQAGETGLAGVQIQVIAVESLAGPGAFTATTNSAGFWRVAGLAPGSYRVVEPNQPAGYLDGQDAAGTVNGAIAGVASNPGDAITGVVLSSGAVGREYNFGELIPASISGLVHAATDGDCEVDPHDILLAGVRIDLLDAQGALVQTAYTDAAGRYSLGGLAPGVYTLVEHQPEDYFDGDAHAGSAGGVVGGTNVISGVVLASGATAIDYNFCEHVGLDLSGHVYHDQDNDGRLDPNESGIGGVAVILLDAQGVVVETTTTSTDPATLGHYRFTHLPQGVYSIREIQPAGCLDGIDTPGDRGGVAAQPGDQISQIELVWGQSGHDYNFGELLPASIAGLVHASTDGDCEVDPHDILLSGVRIDLLNTQGQTLQTTFTDASGGYRFDGLAPGEYAVLQHQPDEYFDGDAHAGTAGGDASQPNRVSGIVLSSGLVAVDYNFCEHVGVELSGHVYHDQDNDGQFDASETGLGGVTLTLLDSAGNEIATATTSSDPGQLGAYVFTHLPPGIYAVRETQPAGYLDGLDTPGDRGGVAENPGDRIGQIELVWGHNARNYNFGELLPASISGLVHAGVDGDCEVGPNDILLEGVQIDLLGQQGQWIASTHTNALGVYRFEGLAPGVYRVVEHQPPGYLDGDAHAGSAGGLAEGSNVISGVVISSGVAAFDYNFCELAPVELTGHVYHDQDNDGQRDEGEIGLGGVTVILLDAQGVQVAVTTTSTEPATLGAYAFSQLRPGVYSIREIQPAGYFDGLDSPGNLGGFAENPGDRITNIALIVGQDGRDYDFGELVPAGIRGRVHVETDGDVEFEPGENPLAGVTIELLDANGAVLRTTQTDAAGEYAFGDLRPGVYAVHQVQPAEYFDGGQRIGSGGGQIVTANWIGQIVVASADHLVDYNFAETPAGQVSGFVFQDGPTVQVPAGGDPSEVIGERDGLRTDDDTPLAGVVLELRDGVTGEPVLASAALPGHYAPGPIRTTTDAAGGFRFSGLAPGTYAVYQVHPVGYVDGIDTPGSTGGVAANGALPPEIAEHLTRDPAGDAIVRIPLAAGEHSTDNNFSEIRIEFLPPPPPPPVDPPAVQFPSGGESPAVAAPPAAGAPFFAPLADIDERLYAPEEETLELYNYRGRVRGMTWHLSVVDAGQPRSIAADGARLQLTGVPVNVAAWDAAAMNLARWTLHKRPLATKLDEDVLGGEVLGGAELERASVLFGRPGAIPVSGDFNGDGVAEIGVFIAGQWYIDINGNGRWDDGDLWAKLGNRDDLPVAGDWDGDGKTDIGVYGPAWSGDPRAVAEEPGLPDLANPTSGKRKNPPPAAEYATGGHRRMMLTSQGEVRADLIDHVFHFGVASELPVVGDFNGDGVDTIAVFRDGRWYLDADGDGRWTDADLTAVFGQPGDLPVAGDFNGDGIDEIGVYRSGQWLLDTNRNLSLDAQDRVFELGGEDDLPVVGDWDADGVDDPGLYHSAGR